MTLLVQTEAHVKQRQERRKKARKRLVQDALKEVDVRAIIDQIVRPVGAPPTEVATSSAARGPTRVTEDQACTPCSCCASWACIRPDVTL